MDFGNVLVFSSQHLLLKRYTKQDKIACIWVYVKICLKSLTKEQNVLI